MWAGSESIGRYSLAETGLKTRGTVSAAGGGIKAIAAQNAVESLSFGGGFSPDDKRR
jgi:hypothetical protein